METLAPVYSAAQIREAVSLSDALEPVSQAFQAVSGGRVHSPVYVLHPTDYSDMHVKSAVMTGCPDYAVKLAGWSDRNGAAGLPSSNGFVMLFDATSCQLKAVLKDEHYLSDIRTAAAGALAARHLAPATIRIAGVLGAGEQAFLQLQALALVRSFATVIVWGRTAKRVAGLIDRIRDWRPDLDVQAAESPEAVARSADLLITATASREPVLRGEWLRPGQHVTAIGADDGLKVELDRTCLERADLVVVDSAAQAHRFGDIRAASNGSEAEASHLVDCEIGELIAGQRPGRQNSRQITIATFVGLGIQDLLMARHALESLTGPGCRPQETA